MITSACGRRLCELCRGQRCGCSCHDEPPPYAPNFDRITYFEKGRDGDRDWANLIWVPVLALGLFAWLCLMWQLWGWFVGAVR